MTAVVAGGGDGGAERRREALARERPQARPRSTFDDLRELPCSIGIDGHLLGRSRAAEYHDDAGAGAQQSVHHAEWTLLSNSTPIIESGRFAEGTPAVRR